MKKLLLSALGLFAVITVSAQFPYVDIEQIRFVSQVDLQNCNDSSLYLGDTITTRGVVIMDGNLSEVSSSSVTGGSRPFIHLVDTAYLNGVSSGPFGAINVMGVVAGTSNPNAAIENALAGDVLELDVVVNEFNGGVQLQPISAAAVSIVGIDFPPAPTVVPVSDLQDNMRINQLTTGEQWEGAYVEIQNVTVTNVSVFSSGNRTEFTVEDASGNQILVADRYLGMKVDGVSTVNPNSPLSAGNFVAPSVGTVFNYIRGVIVQDENGPCYPNASGFAGGYEINPIDSTDFDKAASPANISNVSRNPLVPNASQSVTVTADIIDNDGVVTSATLFYTADQNAPANLFQSVTMTNTSGSIYSATIPATPLDSVVRYFIEAVDDSSNVTTSPNTPMGAPLNTYFYTVRPNGPTVMDIQFVPDVTDGDSKIVGDTITVTGIVTASYQPGDIGYLYMQDPTANEFAGIFVEGGPVSVFSFNRGDEITVQGVVAEQFGFTKLQALTAVATGSTGTITPIVLNPSDTNFFSSANRTNLEPYESMVVRLENPMTGGTVNIINGNLGFGEYTVGSGPAATTTTRVLAGRQSGTQAQSSLDVSVVSDSAAYAASMNVPAVQANNTQVMTAMEGMMYYSFGNFKVTPRNNADLVNFSQPLVSIAPIFSSSVETAIYPNPANNRVTVQVDEDYAFDLLNIQILDVTGRVVTEMRTALSMNNINLSGLENGIYVVRLSNNNEMIHSSKLILNK